MLYSTYYNKHLDLLRTVDDLFDKAIVLDGGVEYSKQISLENYLTEFRTLVVNLPRRVGKTTYLRNLRDKVQFDNTKNVILITKLFSDRNVHLSQFPIDILLFDEYSNEQIKQFLKHDKLAARLHRKSFIFSLATP